MSSIKEFADQFQNEVVADMADSFFGARKEVDNALEAFPRMVKEFMPLVEQMFQAAATLRLLLLDDRTADDFAAALGLGPGAILPAEGAPTHVFESIPFALTRQGRYVRCVCLAYEALQSITSEYIHGRYYDDPKEHGRKRLTMHYNRLVEFARIINEEIRKVNEGASTTAMLREVRNMNPEQMEREDILGDVSLMEGGSLDKDMCFMPIDFQGYQLPQVTDLPSMYEVRDAIRRFCKGVYEERKEEAGQAMVTLQGR